MSKPSGSAFIRPRRDDGDSFVEQGTAGLREPISTVPAAEAHDQHPARTSREGRGEKERRGVASYKHKEINHERLRRLAYRLDRNMGDMLDEALERMLPEWIAQVPPEPEF